MRPPRAEDWFAAPAVPLDLNGPVDRPYRAPAADLTDEPIAALFADMVAQRPDEPALLDHETVVGYAELARRVSALAARIAARVPPGGSVALLLANGPGCMVGLLACLAAGRVCLVLNADHPAERNAGILAESGAAAIIVDGAVPPAGPLAAIAIPLHADAGPSPGALVPLGPDAPAVVLYTSGSTGRPKGIALSQRTILSRVANNIHAMHLGPDDRFLSLGAFGTTAGLVASLIALLCGTPQCLVSVMAAGLSDTLDLIRRARVTVLWGVPALLRALFAAGAAAPGVLASLRLIRTFGERLLVIDLDAWRRALPARCAIAVTYGQTEVTVAQWFVPPGFRADGPVLPVGYLLPEHRYAIQDDAGAPVPPGGVGELLVRGRCVANGEWRAGRCEPGRAAAVAGSPDERVLPTGDLVRLRPDHLLEVVGRLDRQVKVRGQRVEPAEIEAFLRGQTGVAEAAVIPRAKAGGVELIAWIVAEAGAPADLPARLRDAARHGLHGAMQPQSIRLLPALPRLPGGKLDEAALLRRE